jgi:dolichol-phosphate mannosyltransferase
VRVVRLSRNFGSFTAIRAGLDFASGTDCVAVISADLQDPPEHLAAMLDAWRAGNKVVLAVRRRRDDRLTVRLFASLYYRLVRRWALPEMPPGGFDFFLVDRQVADVLCQFQERNTSLVGLVLWLGFRKAILPYDRQARPFGQSMWSFRKKLSYFVDTFVAFTVAPLRIASAVGMSASVLSFAWCAFVVLQAAFLGRPFPGWTSLMAVVCFLGGIQLLSLGIIGEYLWRNLEESRRRPLYLIDHTFTGAADRAAAIPVSDPCPTIIAASAPRR